MALMSQSKYLSRHVLVTTTTHQEILGFLGNFVWMISTKISPSAQFLSNLLGKILLLILIDSL